MTLRTNGLDWLAQNAGSGNCFATSGISYRDADGVYQSGGTKDVVNAFVVANMVGKQTETIIAGADYNDFKAINDGQDLTITDVGEAADREADGGSYPRYCTGTTPTPPPTTKPVTGPIEVYVGGGESCPPGAPSVTLDTSQAFAFFKSTPYEYIGVGGIEVHNESTQCRAYFAWEARVWDGYGYTTCPITAPEMQEITRYLAEATGRPLSLTRLDASETDTIWGSFEVPPAMEGEKTICLSLWGNYDYEALITELNAAGYYDKT